jgi:hypothetical protein
MVVSAFTRAEKKQKKKYSFTLYEQKGSFEDRLRKTENLKFNIISTLGLIGSILFWAGVIYVCRKYS